MTAPAWTPPPFCECYAFPLGALCSYCQLAKKRAGQASAASASSESRERAYERSEPLSSNDWDAIERGELWNRYPGQPTSRP